MFEDKSLAAGWEDDWLVVRIKNPEADVVGDIEGADSETGAPIGAQASLINTGEPVVIDASRQRIRPRSITWVWGAH